MLMMTWIQKATGKNLQLNGRIIVQTIVICDVDRVDWPSRLGSDHMHEFNSD